eukprot:Gb_24226 [translate_table: standard]
MGTRTFAAISSLPAMDFGFRLRWTNPDELSASLHTCCKCSFLHNRLLMLLRFSDFFPSRLPDFFPRMYSVFHYRTVCFLLPALDFGRFQTGLQSRFQYTRAGNQHVTRSRFIHQNPTVSSHQIFLTGIWHLWTCQLNTLEFFSRTRILLTKSSRENLSLVSSNFSLRSSNWCFLLNAFLLLSQIALIPC